MLFYTILKYWDKAAFYAEIEGNVPIKMGRLAHL